MKTIIAVASILILAACSKSDTTPEGNTENNKGCKTKVVTTYDLNGNVSQQSTYYYNAGQLDSILSTSGNTYSKTIYKYSGAERTGIVYLNNVKQQHYTVDKMDGYGNTIESYTVSNGKEGFKTKYTYTCN